MEELDIRYYSKWQLKVENERLVIESKNKRDSINLGMPTRTTINTTTNCNLSCGMCRYHGQEKILPETLPFKTFKEIGEQLFPYSKEIHLSVKGEPLLTPYFEKTIDVISQYGVRLNLTTNGMLLTPKTSEMIIPVLRDVKISFDGAKKDTFEKIRAGSRYETIIDNIRAFVNLRNQYVNSQKTNDSFYRPTITLQTVLMADNIEELPDIVKIAHYLGVDRVKGFNLTVTNPKYLNKSLLFDQQHANIYLKQALELAESFRIKAKYQELFDPNIDIFNYKDEEARKRECAFLWNQINVEVNGDVRPCCHDKSPIIGNVYKSTLKDIWNNEIYQEMRARLDSKDPYSCCKHCAMQSRKVLDAYAFIFCEVKNYGR